MTGEEAPEAGPVPAALVALTVNVYGVPSVRPVTVQRSGPDVHVHVLPSGVEVTVYPVIALPPLEAGGDHARTACPSPGTAATPVGAPGTDRGVTGADGLEDGPVPTMVVALTVNE